MWSDQLRVSLILHPQELGANGSSEVHSDDVEDQVVHYTPAYEVFLFLCCCSD